MYYIKAPSKETIKKLYNFYLTEILSILYLSNLKRKIYDKLVKWRKESQGTSAILLEGDYVKIGLNQEKPYK